MTEQSYIVIPNWDGKDGFQHYRDRDPIWIKNYRTLMAKDEYLELSFHVRGILHGLWLEYAASNRQLRDNTVTLSRRLGQRVTRRDLETLNHAGFIHFAASTPLAPRYQDASPHALAESREDKEGKEPKQEQDQKPATAIAVVDAARANGTEHNAWDITHIGPLIGTLAGQAGKSHLNDDDPEDIPL